jgi:hypothetical protein
MSHASRLLARIGLVLVLLGSTAMVQAQQITILFTGYGERVGPPGSWVGKADDFAGLSSPIPGDWDVFRSEVYDLPTNSMSGTFSFVDTVGNNSFSGRFVGGWEFYGDMTHVRVFNNYVVQSGTGMFSGATGFGEDRVYTNFLAGRYVESGLLKVTLVPEPSQALLLAAGLLTLSTLWRRRT